MPERDERASAAESALCSQSIERSRERRTASRKRRRRRRFLGLLAPPVAALAGALAVTAAPRIWDDLPTLDAVTAGAQSPTAPAHARRDAHTRSNGSASPRTPSAADANRARRFIDTRTGSVSFAAIDAKGRTRSAAGDRRYVSASVVKALLLAAELRRLDAEGTALDPATKQLLSAMITYSDNDAADTIYYRVGDVGLMDVAARAGMESFSVAGYWANAQIAAEDMARFFYRLDRILGGSHREYAKGLLGSVVEEQRWGIPAVAGERWSVRFKGGWRETELGQLAHQAAELRRGGERISVAVLTDGQPSQAYAQETVRGVADRLLPG